MTVGKTPPLIIPVALYSIVISVGGLFGLPLLNASFKFQSNTYAILSDLVWLIAAVAAFIGTVIALKPKQGSDIGDKIVWIFFMLVWIGMGLVPFFREGGF